MDGAEGTQEPQNNAPVNEDLEVIKAELEEEKTASATLKEALAGKDARITELEGQIGEANAATQGKASELEASVVELAKAREASDVANTKYREALVAGHPEIPQELITGNSIDELFDSITKGQAVVESVKKAMEAQATAGKVPAGAPIREGVIGLEGMSAKEKIVAGIQPK